MFFIPETLRILDGADGTWQMRRFEGLRQWLQSMDFLACRPGSLHRRAIHASPADNGGRTLYFSKAAFP
jgi:hypothetical protein